MGSARAGNRMGSARAGNRMGSARAGNRMGSARAGNRMGSARAEVISHAGCGKRASVPPPTPRLPGLFRFWAAAAYVPTNSSPAFVSSLGRRRRQYHPPSPLP
eukprot:scaffold3214_cov45-Isochrysis_galbana.AAC.1